MPYDLDQCLAMNARRAARAVTRRYDAALRAHGITAAQFVLLGALQRQPDWTVTGLAEQLTMERTTLTRNLDLLQARGLVAAEAETGVARRSHVTPVGEGLIAALLPVWESTQEAARADLEPGEFAKAIMVLQRLAQL
jgi:DNA-binding MarR family transcriptional regulator